MACVGAVYGLRMALRMTLEACDERAWESRMKRGLAVAALVLTAGFAADADVLVGGKLQDLPPRPEDLKVFDGRINMAARLVFKGTEKLATHVEKKTEIELQMGFIAKAKGGADNLRLRCKLFFVSTSNQISRVKKDQTCFEGNLAAVAGKWVAMNITTVFRPVETDQSGTAGVRVEVYDEASGAVQYFMPTYDWQGGRP